MRVRMQSPASRWPAVIGMAALWIASAAAQPQRPSVDTWLPELRKGLWVQVEGEWLGGVLRADEIKVTHGELDQSEVTSEVVEADSTTGRIRTRVGVVIVTNERSQFQKEGVNGWSAVQPGHLVEADGPMQRDGTLLADELEVATPSTKPRPEGWYQEHELTGRIDAVDPATHTLTVLGVVVRCDNRTRNKTRDLR